MHVITVVVPALSVLHQLTDRQGDKNISNEKQQVLHVQDYLKGRLTELSNTNCVLSSQF